jgi:unsaturated rhamnogalacturonyl hydrolase
MRKTILYLFISILTIGCAFAQKVKYPMWSEKMAKTVLTIWKDSLIMQPDKPVKWSYDEGVVLEGITNIWKLTGKGEYFRFIQKSMDHFVQDNGSIRRYKPEDYNIDNVKNGRILLTLYNVTGKEKYYKAATLLREQLKGHPRTKEGGFWHKKVYPYQMWLDGLYMGQPFYTEYAVTYNESAETFTDIANQFIWMESHARDSKTGLLYHGWDESGEQKWANPQTGNSPHFWGRAMGWFGMALADVLENFPKDHPKRAELVNIFGRYAEAVCKVQDSKSGVWYQILDKKDSAGNYKEASASCMFVYAIAKGVRLGVLDKKYESTAAKGYFGIIQEFIKTDPSGQVNLHGTVSVAGLGGNPYRDGSYQYYLSEKVVVNDPKGVGAFLLAASEMELRNIPQSGKDKLVLLDNYFNSEVKKDASGQERNWHYTWNDMSNGGFSLWGENARYMGAETKHLREAPTAENLKNANIYIIVDPDNEKDSPKPNRIMEEHQDAILDWVDKGGILVLMGNDFENAELSDLNGLGERIGFMFGEETMNKVEPNKFEMGLVNVAPNDPIFKTAKKLFLKEISTLELLKSPHVVTKHKGDAVLGLFKYGKGLVFAVGDPWLYNEYTDGRKLPAEYQNFQAGNELMNFLLSKSKPVTQ